MLENDLKTEYSKKKKKQNILYINMERKKLVYYGTESGYIYYHWKCVDFYL